MSWRRALRSASTRRRTPAASPDSLAKVSRGPSSTDRCPELQQTDAVELEKLIPVLRAPGPRLFAASGFELRTADEEDEPSDAPSPVCPNKLEEWAVGDRLLRAGLADLAVDDAQQVERLRGELPPGTLGGSVRQPIAGNVAAVLDKSTGLRAGEPNTADVSIFLPSGTRLDGSVPRVYGDRVVRISTRGCQPSTASEPGCSCSPSAHTTPARTWSAVAVGRGTGRIR